MPCFPNDWCKTQQQQMSALSRLAVGSAVGTSRPATAQQQQHTSQPSEGGNGKTQQQHPLLQALGFPPHGDGWPAGWEAAAVHAGSAVAADVTAAARKAAGAASRSQPQLLSSTLSQVVAAAAAPAQAPSKHTAQATAQSSSRPVTPHATKPYRSMPALSILQCTAAADGSCSRPATAAGRLLTPSYVSTNLDQACSWSSSGSRLAHCPHPGTAGSCHSYAATSHKAQQHRILAAAPAGALRPGSAAAAKILSAMDKACVATPTAAAHGRPGQLSDHCSSSSSSMLALPEQQQQQQQQLEPSWLPPSSLDDEQAAHHNSSSSSSEQRQHAAVGSALGATDSSRPSTAAVQSVLATAAVPGDGVEARLAAIRQKNSSFDHSADLDIVYELDEGASLQAGGGMKDDACSVSGVGSKLAVACTAAGGDSASVACGSAGQQASAMVLNLDDLAQCTIEVLMIELESLDVEQLVALQHVLLAG